MGISNLWNVFFISALSQAAFVVLILFSKFFKNKNISQLILGVFITVFSVILLNNLLYWNGLLDAYPSFLFSVVSIRFLLAPLFFFYCLTFIYAKSKFDFKDLAHFLLFLIVTLIYLPLSIKSGSEKLAIVQSPEKFISYNFFQLGNILRWVFPLHLITYPIVIFILLRKNHKESRDPTLRKKQLQKKWLTFLNSLFLLYGLLMLLYQILVTGEIGGIEKDFIISAIMCLAVYSISYIGMMNPELLEKSHLLEKISKLKYANSGLQEKTAKEITQRLDELMLEHTLFLKPDLNLQDVAASLDVSRHMLSQSLNMIHNKSFHKYINEYRINYAIGLLKSKTKENNIKTVLYASGFNNRASFNNNFKKITGMTASEYIKHNIL